MIEKNKKALEARRAAANAQKAAETSLPLPEGWIRTESRSRPGETVYENTVTGERQAWFPTEPAKPASGPVDPKRVSHLKAPDLGRFDFKSFLTVAACLDDI